jgi:hypothetical protein
MSAKDLCAILAGQVTEQQCATALSLSHGDPDAALSLLMEGSIPAAPAAPDPSADAASPGRWEYDDGPPGWKQIGGAPEQAGINAAHAAGQALFQFSFGRWTYQVDVQSMTQTNVQTGKARQVRRVDGGGGGGGGLLQRFGRKGGGGGHAATSWGGAAAGAEGQDLVGTLHYDQELVLSAADFARETEWTVLEESRGEYDPSQEDPITCEPFGAGPVVELACSGSVGGE